MTTRIKSMWRSTSARAGLSLLVASILLVPLSMAAEAPEGDARVVTSMTAKEYKTLLGEEGYLGVEITEDGNLLFRMEGTPVYLVLLKGHAGIMIRAGWTGTTADLRKVNEWNKNANYSRAYIDDEGDPIIELDLDLTGGITIARIKDFLTTAKGAVAGFVSLLGK